MATSSLRRPSVASVGLCQPYSTSYNQLSSPTVLSLNQRREPSSVNGFLPIYEQSGRRANKLLGGGGASLSASHQSRGLANTSSGYFAPSAISYRQTANSQHPRGILNVYETSEHLPSLPVPNLNDTLERLKETIWPIAMNSAEFANALHLIERFAKTAGPKLDSLLRTKAEQTKNWMTHDWWIQEAYLKSRSPLVINSNPSMIYPVLPFEVNSQRVFVQTVSQLISGIIDFKLSLAHGYNPEATSADNEYHLDPYLCYNQYKNIFGSIRVPGEHCDSVLEANEKKVAVVVDHNQLDQQNVANQEEQQQANEFNLVISYRGKFFEIQLKDIENESARLESLSSILTRLIDSSQTSNETGHLCLDEGGAGVLTATNRVECYKAYRMLDEDSMSALHKAQFVVCIDTIPDQPEDQFTSNLLSAPSNSEQHLEALSRQILHADRHNVGNRWFDKPIQLIVVTNEQSERLLGAGINYEHSFAEAVVVTKMIEYSYDKTVQKQRQLLNSPRDNLFAKQQIHQETTSSAFMRQLKMFNENYASQLDEQLKKAKRDFISQVDQFDLSYLAYRQYGASSIKSWHFSPDSWFQVALQLAYYKLHKRPGPCYESASTRRFAYGRTETIRSLTKDVAQFCFEPNYESLQAAIASHKKYAIAANNASAIDRVLLAYRLIFNELRANNWSWGLPDTFGEIVAKKGNEANLNDLFSSKELDTIGSFLNNELIERSKRFALSTSQVSSSAHANIFMSYGPLLADGYGCCYNITGQQISASITANSSNQSFSCEVRHLNDRLKSSLDQMRDIVEEQQRQKS